MPAIECRWPGCTSTVKAQEWACKTHMGRIPSELRAMLTEAFNWQAIVIDGAEPSQRYVAVTEAVRDLATSYNERWSVFPGYEDGAAAATATASATDLGPPNRRRRRRALVT